MRTRFVIENHVTPSLNRTLNESLKARLQRKKFYARYVMAFCRYRHPNKVRLTIERHTPDKLLDTENFVGGTKQLTDAIKNRGIIKDDDPATIVEPVYIQVKVGRAHIKKTIIIIEDVPDTAPAEQVTIEIQ